MSEDARPNLDNIVVILSRTTEPGNIGSTCRAMKTMGLRQLRLIAPLNPKGRSARAFAHGATDVLDAAEVVDSLEDAVDDIQVVGGTTSRRRQLRKYSLMAPRDFAETMVGYSSTQRVAIMFGTERTGLSNDELDVCRYLTTVETAQPQPSLNLAMAVMLYGWEIRQAYLRARDPGAAAGATATGPRSDGLGARPPEKRVIHPHRSTRLPTQFELDTMYGHLAYAMEALDYSDHERRKFLTYLRHLHMRAGIVDWEMQIYHLFARRILELAGKPGFKGL